jgi:hypothetical protein
LEDSSLIETFSTAQIKLIPKKGDTSQIKNWRPISLLSNFYKILSRAINNRLKKVVNRVLSRAQKGFTKTRQIHEVIINLSETINFCEKNNIKGAMICVDQAKAFDSVDHQYMKKVFTFFGFGERFISWLTTIGTNRKACVILENGETSNIFDLLKGTAQGDCPSPIIYNICAQILIFKIELDSSIRRIDTLNGDVPVPLPVPVPANAHILRPERGGDFLHESAMETGKNESFADDSTTCTYLDFNDIYSLKHILSDFADLSGLKSKYVNIQVVPYGNGKGASNISSLVW